MINNTGAGYGKRVFDYIVSGNVEQCLRFSPFGCYGMSETALLLLYAYLSPIIITRWVVKLDAS